MLRRLYTLLYYSLLPFILLRLLWRSCRLPEYRHRLRERFGSAALPKLSASLWVHAVSVGEVVAAVPLIKALKQHTSLPIVVTTMTPTGAERVRALLGDEVQHRYVPYDLPFAIRRFLTAINPQQVVVMETELWPNMLQLCHQRQIPVLLANARLSERSARGYARIGRLTQQLLNQITLVAAQNEADGQRFLRLGLPAQRLQVTGNIKFDMAIPDNKQAAMQLRQTWGGSERPVWVAASTHAGEEAQILDIHAALRETLPDLLLVLVPRHPQRFSDVATLCRERGHQCVLRSEQIACTSETTVFIGDSMGELLLFYAAADVAFVGGSLVPIGGHNLLEPAAMGLPTLTGPHVFNFSEITRLLCACGASVKVDDKIAMIAALQHILSDPEARQRMQQAALQVMENNRGALQRLLDVIPLCRDSA